MAMPERRDLDDSEDDEDYVPQADDNSETDGSDSERKSKKLKLEEQILEKSLEERKAERDALWAEFQASMGGEASSSKIRTDRPNIVRVQVRYKFAGEEIVETKEVPEDSEEARKWPRVPPAPAQFVSTDGSANLLTDSASTSRPDQLQSGASDIDVPTAASTTVLPKKKASGPRKAKQSLAAMAAAAKPKKLSTLDKSKMDWSAHVASSSKEEADELERHRRGGGYLEKVDFLERVDARKEDARGAGKRRR